MASEVVEDVVRRIEMEKESVLFKMYRSWRYFLGYVVLVVLIATLLLVIEILFGSVLSLPHLGSFSIRWLTIIPLLVLAEVLRRYHNDLYVFEKDQVKQISGRLSLKYKVPVVKYLDIRAITIEQGLLGRVLNYGTVALGTAAKEGNEIELAGVGSPLTVANTIEELRNEAARALRRP